MTDSNTTAPLRAYYGRDGRLYHRSSDPFVDGQMVGNIRTPDLAIEPAPSFGCEVSRFFRIASAHPERINVRMAWAIVLVSLVLAAALSALVCWLS